jgi:uncharacterized Tic20 family protein
MASTFLKYSQDTVPREEKVWARRAHLTTLLTYPLALLPFPFTWEVLATLIFPFTVWLSRNKSSYSAKQSLEAIYLQTILCFGYIGFGHAFAQDRVLFVFSYGFMVLVHAILLLISVVQTSLGRNHKYPFSFIPYLFRSTRTQENWKKIQSEFQDKANFTEFRNSIDQMDEYCTKISSQLDELKDPTLRSQARSVMDSMLALRASLIDKPKNYRTVRQYLNYFPQTTAELLEKYSKFQKTNTGDLDPVRLENIKNLLVEVKTTTDQVRNKIQSSETLALDVEIQAMKKNIDFGGY